MFLGHGIQPRFVLLRHGRNHGLRCGPWRQDHRPFTSALNEVFDKGNHSCTNRHPMRVPSAEVLLRKRTFGGDGDGPPSGGGSALFQNNTSDIAYSTVNPMSHPVLPAALLVTCTHLIP